MQSKNFYRLLGEMRDELRCDYKDDLSKLQEKPDVSEQVKKDYNDVSNIILNVQHMYMCFYIKKYYNQCFITYYNQ